MDGRGHDVGFLNHLPYIARAQMMCVMVWISSRVSGRPV